MAPRWRCWSAAAGRSSPTTQLDELARQSEADLHDDLQPMRNIWRGRPPRDEQDEEVWQGWAG
jgi:hypothetical protein